MLALRPLVSALVLIATFVLSSAPALAQWAQDGTAVCNASDAQSAPAIAPDAGGGAYIVWVDHRNSPGSSIFVSRIDAFGFRSPGWPLNGVPLLVSPDRDELRPRISSDALGAIVVWMDTRIDAPSGFLWSTIRAQRVSEAGAALWQPDGVTLGTIYDPYFGGTGYRPEVVADGSGGAFVVWTENTGADEADIFLTRLDGSGVPAAGWSYIGMDICDATRDQINPKLILDGAGGAIAVWQDARFFDYPNDYPNYGIYAQRVAGDGTVLWTANGVTVSNPQHDQTDPVIVSDDHGGALIAWADRRGSTRDIYAHHLDATGAVVSGWPANGLALCLAPGDQGLPVIAGDAQRGAFVAWSDPRGGGSDIFAQHVAADGSLAPGWIANGLPICNASGDQLTPVIAPDGEGGAIFAWQDERAGPDDIYAQRILDSGVVAYGWQPNGLPISTAADIQQRPVIAADGYRNAIIAWTDFRNGAANPDIEAQRAVVNGPVAIEISLVSAEGEPGLARLEWYATDGAGLEAAVERRGEAGEWREIATVTADGGGRILFQDRDVLGGARYGYRLLLRAEGRTFGEAWVMIPGRSQLALAGARPNPTTDRFAVEFSLPDGAPTMLELLDLSGRRIESREVGSLGAGDHRISLDSVSPIAPGIYLLRLSRAGRVLTARACVMH